MKKLQVVFRNQDGVELTFSSHLLPEKPTPEYVADALKALGLSIHRNLNMREDTTFRVTHVGLKENQIETQ